MEISALTDQFLASEFPGAESSIYRDLSLNFKKILEDGQLPPAERFMNLMAVAVALENRPMAELAKTALRELSIPEDQIRETAEVAGIMGMNNIYYKFRSFLSDEVRENYNRAGLRMQSLMKPVTGKHNFEMMALAVSAVNGCPTCVASHEKSLRDLGMEADKIHDVARLAAVAKGLSSLKTAIDFL